MIKAITSTLIIFLFLFVQIGELAARVNTQQLAAPVQTHLSPGDYQSNLPAGQEKIIIPDENGQKVPLLQKIKKSLLFNFWMTVFYLLLALNPVRLPQVLFIFLISFVKAINKITSTIISYIPFSKLLSSKQKSQIEKLSKIIKIDSSIKLSNHAKKNPEHVNRMIAYLESINDPFIAKIVQNMKEDINNEKLQLLFSNPLKDNWKRKVLNFISMDLLKDQIIFKQDKMIIVMDTFASEKTHALYLLNYIRFFYNHQKISISSFNSPRIDNFFLLQSEEEFQKALRLGIKHYFFEKGSFRLSNLKGVNGLKLIPEIPHFFKNFIHLQGSYLKDPRIIDKAKFHLIKSFQISKFEIQSAYRHFFKITKIQEPTKSKIILSFIKFLSPIISPLLLYFPVIILAFPMIYIPLIELTLDLPWVKWLIMSLHLDLIFDIILNSFLFQQISLFFRTLYQIVKTFIFYIYIPALVLIGGLVGFLYLKANFYITSLLKPFWRYLIRTFTAFPIITFGLIILYYEIIYFGEPRTYFFIESIAAEELENPTRVDKIFNYLEEHSKTYPVTILNFTKTLAAMGVYSIVKLSLLMGFNVLGGNFYLGHSLWLYYKQKRAKTEKISRFSIKPLLFKIFRFKKLDLKNTKAVVQIQKIIQDTTSPDPIILTQPDIAYLRAA